MLDHSSSSCSLYYTRRVSSHGLILGHSLPSPHTAESALCLQDANTGASGLMSLRVTTNSPQTFAQTSRHSGNERNKRNHSKRAPFFLSRNCSPLTFSSVREFIAWVTIFKYSWHLTCQNASPDLHVQRATPKEACCFTSRFQR